MCIETEAKLKVDSLQDIAAKLKELGAEFVEQQLQKDCYFDCSDTALTKSDRGLRLRRQTVGSDEKVFLTYKGAKQSSEFKKRQEIELQVSDAGSAERLLSALGFEKVVAVEKKRRVWRLDDCDVALDQLDLLGTFVEVEGPDENKITNVLKKLGLADLPHIKKTYSHLVTEKLKESPAHP